MLKAGWVFQLDRDTKAKAGFKKAKAFLNGRRPVDDWKKLYAVISSEIPGSFFVGPGLALYASEAIAELHQPALETFALGPKAKVSLVERNVYRRVKNAFHFSILVPGRERIVLEAPSDQDRKEWLEALQQSRTTDAGVTKSRRAFMKSVREGYLEKLGKQEKIGGVMGGWHVRYCLLAYNPTRLEYFLDFEDALQKNPRGVILLEETQVASMPGPYLDNDFAFSLTVTGGRRFVFSAPTGEEMWAWLEDIGKLKAHVPTVPALENEAEKRGKARAEVLRRMLEEMEQQRQENEMNDETKLRQLDEAKEAVRDAQLRAREEHLELRSRIAEVKAQLVKTKQVRLRLHGEIAAAQEKLSACQEQGLALQARCDAVLEDSAAISHVVELLLSQEELLTQREQAVQSREDECALRDQAIEQFAGLMTTPL